MDEKFQKNSGRQNVVRGEESGLARQRKLSIIVKRCEQEELTCPVDLAEDSDLGGMEFGECAGET